MVMRTQEWAGMRDPKIFLHELEILISQQVQYVMGIAVRCPAEGCEQWDRLLNRYGVAKIQRHGTEGRLDGEAQGAPAAECRAVLAAIRDLALPALTHIEAQYAHAIQSDRLLRAWVGRIRERLSSLDRLSDASTSSGSWSRLDTSWSLAAAL